MRKETAYITATLIVGMLYLMIFGVMAFVLWTAISSVIGLLVDFNFKDLYVVTLTGLFFYWINKTK